MRIAGGWAIREQLAWHDPCDVDLPLARAVTDACARLLLARSVGGRSPDLLHEQLDTAARNGDRAAVGGWLDCGVSVVQNIRGEWGAEARLGAAWQTDIPGLAHSSPIVWGRNDLVTTVVTAGGTPLVQRGAAGNAAAPRDPFEHSWMLLCLDHTTGTLRGQHTVVRRIPHARRHPKLSQANSTPVANGEDVITLLNQGAFYGYTVVGRA